MNVIEPLQFSFIVNCAPAHAFEVWTSKASMWWPPSHTVTGAEGLQVIFEEGRGGRVFERRDSALSRSGTRKFICLLTRDFSTSQEASSRFAMTHWGN